MLTADAKKVMAKRPNINSFMTTRTSPVTLKTTKQGRFYFLPLHLNQMTV